MLIFLVDDGSKSLTSCKFTTVHQRKTIKWNKKDKETIKKKNNKMNNNQCGYLIKQYKKKTSVLAFIASTEMGKRRPGI